MLVLKVEILFPPARSTTHVGYDAYESVCMTEELLLEGDDDGLQRRSLVVDVRRYFADVGVVQSRIDLVQHEEWSWLVAKQWKQSLEPTD